MEILWIKPKYNLVKVSNIEAKAESKETQIKELKIIFLSGNKFTFCQVSLVINKHNMKHVVLKKQKKRLK